MEALEKERDENLLVDEVGRQHALHGHVKRLANAPHFEVAPSDAREHTCVLPVASFAERVQHLEPVQREVRACKAHDERHLEGCVRDAQRLHQQVQRDQVAPTAAHYQVERTPAAQRPRPTRLLLHCTTAIQLHSSICTVRVH